MPQTTWANPVAAFAGLRVGNSDADVIGSYINEEAAGIPFGVAVVQGTLDTDCLLPADALDWRKFLGVTAHTVAVANAALAGTLGIPADTQANVIKHGEVYVLVEEAVTPLSPVFCRFATGTGTQKGAFRKSSDSGTCMKLAGCRYTSTAAANSYAKLQVTEVIVDPESKSDPAFVESFPEGLAKGLAILTTAGAAYDATAGVLNVLHLGSGHKLGMIPIVGQTVPPAMSALGLDIQCDQTDNDGMELISNILGLSGRPFIIGTDPAFYFKIKLLLAAINGTDEFHVGFRRAEALNATFDNYLDLASIGIVTAASPGLLQLETILNNGATTTTNTTNTLASATEAEFTIKVSAAGVVTYLINGVAPITTAAFTFDDGDPVIPFLHYLQANAAQTGAFNITQWEVGYQ